jgi:hypothetical protein
MREEFYQQLKAELEAWHQSQSNQQDSYEYERSLVEVLRKLGQRILQESVGEVPESRNEKKR